jgi:Tol biopolymer transport system component
MGLQGDQFVFALTLEDEGIQNRLFGVSEIGSEPRELVDQDLGCGECMAIAPDGLRIAVAVDASDGTSTVGIVDATGLTPLAIPGAPTNLAPDAWSPDGTRIAIDGWDDADPSVGGVYTVAPDGTDLRRITRRMGDVPLAFSPDGSDILFVRPTGESHFEADLYVVSAAGGTPTQLNEPGTDVQCCDFGIPGTWTPDGKTIAFTQFEPTEDEPGRSAVFLVSPSGDDRRRITPWSEWMTSAHVSPDGRSIAYDLDNPEGGGRDIVLIDRDGSHPRPLTDADSQGMGSCCSTWSPDGSRLLFTRAVSDESTTLWIVNADGSGLAQVATEPGWYEGYGFLG